MAEIPLLPTTGVAESLRHIVQGVCRMVGERQHSPSMAPIAMAVWLRLRELFNRFSALAARYRAGTLRPPRPPRTAAPRPAQPRPDPPDRPPTEPSTRPRALAPRLPCGKFWLARRLPGSAVFGTQLQALLAEPEMLALIAAAPQAKRLLRPLCRMLMEGPLPEVLALPPRPRRPRPPAPPKAPRPPRVRQSKLYPGYRLERKLARRMVEWPYRMPQTITARGPPKPA